MRVTRRRAIGVVGCVGALALLWAPSLVARSYTDPAQPINFLSRPDKGWRFLYDTVRLSRSTKLGSEGLALATAKRIWGRADAVELVYLERPLSIPAAGLPPSRRPGIVRPRSPLTWFVRGHVGNGPRQLVGLIDYGSGRVIWDLRRVTRSGR